MSATSGCKAYSFLIDTGSSLYLLPYDPGIIPFLRPTTVTLMLQVRSIRCYGEVDVDLPIHSIRRSFLWSFVLADVVHPILRTDFLAAKSLLVDCKHKMFIDSSTQCQIPLETSDSPITSY